MIYFDTENEQHVVILEPANMEDLKAGNPQKTPNKAVLIVYTPDAAWLTEQIIANMDNMTPELLDKLIAESQTRPEVKNRPYHPPIRVR